MAQDDNTITHNLSTYFTIKNKYIGLPVKNGAPKRNIGLCVDGIRPFSCYRVGTRKAKLVRLPVNISLEWQAGSIKG